MDQVRYCTTVCGSKCCVMSLGDEPLPVRCPRLSNDGSCTVYQERYADGQPDLVVVGYYRSMRYKTLDGRRAERPFYCGRIEQIHAAGRMDPEVAKQCCVIHPELLEAYEQDDQNRS